MAKIPVSLQLYSVREECAKDLLGVIREVAKMGYDGVEFAGYHGHSAQVIKDVLDDVGLKCSGAHVSINQFTDDVFQETAAFHMTLGCDWLIVPWIPSEMHDSVEACEATGKKFTEIAEKLAKLGLKTGFHAHEGDLRKLEDGRTAWDVLAATTPKEFIMQYDTANGMSGGADPVQPILDWPGRNLSLHLKEWNGADAALLGEGQVPFEKVFEAAENGGGVEWYVIEHESELAMPPMEAVAKCRENLRKLGR